MPDINDVIHEDLVISPSTAEQIPVNVTQSKTGNVITVTTYDKDGAPTSKTLTEPTLEVTKSGNVVTLKATDANGSTQKDVYEPTIAVTKHGTEDPVPAREGDFDVKIKVANGSGNGFIEQTVTIPNPNTELSDRAHVDSVSRSKTRTGNPIMITDAAAEIADKLQIRLEPAQDLHGYSKPWVGGAGKNLLDLHDIATDTKNNVTITPKKNTEGAVTSIVVSTSGSASSTTVWSYTKNLTFDFDTILSGGSSSATIDVNSGTYLDNGNGVTIPANTNITSFRIRVPNGGTANATLYPMIRKATDMDATFAPYSNLCPITGYDAVNVPRAGKNLLGDYGHKWENATGAYSEQASARSTTKLPVNPGDTFAFSKNCTFTNSGSNIVVRQYDENGDYKSNGNSVMSWSQTSGIYTVPDGIYFIGITQFYDSNLEAYENSGNVQVEMGSTVTQYEAPHLAVYPITLSTASRTVSGTTTTAGTVYGGNLVLNRDGSGSIYVDTGTHTCTGTEATWGSNTTANSYYRAMSDANEIIACNWLSPLSSGQSTDMPNWTARMNGNHLNLLIMLDSNYDTLDKAKALMASNNLQVVFTLEHPVTYELTANQVQTLLGYNYIYADAGIITLDYRQEKYAEESTVLGLLPTGTATGNPITISDGAANMPLKKLQIAIEPKQDLSNGNPSPTNICPISGWTGANMTRTGKNLIPDGTDTSNGYIAYKMLLSDGSVSDNGVQFVSEYFRVKPSEIYTVTQQDGTLNNASICFYDKNKAFISGTKFSKRTSFQVTTPDNAVYCRCDQMYDSTKLNQVEVGSVSTAVIANESAAYTITFPSEAGTVYGGSLILDEHGDGTLTVDQKKVVLNGTETWTVSEGSQGENAINVFAYPSGITDAALILGNCISDKLQSVSPDISAATLVTIEGGCVTLRAAGSGPALLVPFSALNGISRTSTIAAMQTAVKAWLAADPLTLVYKLATPITYTLTANQIRTLLGSNTIWADCGAVSIEYGKDIGSVGSATLSIVAESETWTASKNHAVGDLFVIGEELYRCQSAIATGETISPGGNCYTLTIAEAIKQAKLDLEQEISTATTGMATQMYVDTEIAGATSNLASSMNPTFEGSISLGRKSGTTKGSGSSAVGGSVTASGANSHAEGGATVASGINSHAEGGASEASASYSHAEGDHTTASGKSSHSEGTYTQANHRSQHVFGEYNVLDDSANEATERGTYIEIVGKGTGSQTRSNARTLDWSGNETLAGSLTLGSTTLTEANLQALLALLN